MELQLRVRLAVLSACETAQPGTELPDEVVALPTGLLQAGVAGIVASQWSVPDRATAMLMAEFYLVLAVGRGGACRPHCAPPSAGCATPLPPRSALISAPRSAISPAGCRTMSAGHSLTGFISSLTAEVMRISTTGVRSPTLEHEDRWKRTNCGSWPRRRAET